MGAEGVAVSEPVGECGDQLSVGVKVTVGVSVEVGRDRVVLRVTLRVVERDGPVRDTEERLTVQADGVGVRLPVAVGVTTWELLWEVDQLGLRDAVSDGLGGVWVGPLRLYVWVQVRVWGLPVPVDREEEEVTVEDALRLLLTVRVGTREMETEHVRVAVAVGAVPDGVADQVDRVGPVGEVEGVRDTVEREGDRRDADRVLGVAVKESWLRVEVAVHCLDLVPVPEPLTDRVCVKERVRLRLAGGVTLRVHDGDPVRDVVLVGM